MATAYVTEYTGVGVDGMMQAALTPPVANQTVTFTTSTQTSSAFNDLTKMVRVHAIDACFVQFGENPTATVASISMPAGHIEHFAVKKGHKAAFYDGSS